jgi:ribonuclease R
VHCSANERRADEASRDVEAWLKCYFMQDKLGEEFTGIVAGVTTFGIFVQLDELFVEGLVHVTGLGADYFQYDEARHELRGERTGKRYQLTDRVTCRWPVDLEARKIDLVLVERSRQPAPPPPKKSRIERPAARRRGRPHPKQGAAQAASRARHCRRPKPGKSVGRSRKGIDSRTSADSADIGQETGAPRARSKLTARPSRLSEERLRAAERARRPRKAGAPAAPEPAAKPRQRPSRSRGAAAKSSKPVAEGGQAARALKKAAPHQPGSCIAGTGQRPKKSVRHEVHGRAKRQKVEPIQKRVRRSPQPRKATKKMTHEE